jgi:hypothetical protein
VRDSKRRQQQNREWLITYKAAQSCARCPEHHPACLDFHHREGEQKIMRISRMISRGATLTAIKREIAKCEVICSNCHRKHHFENGTGPWARRDGENGR